jgi:hypothetical protein
MTVQSRNLQTPPQSLANRLRCNNSRSCRDSRKEKELCARNGFGKLTAQGLPLIHSLNWFRLHQPAMYFESQTQFGDIPWTR